VRSVCGAAAVIEVLRNGEPDARDRQRADRYDAMTAGMLEALTSRELQQPIQSLEMPADDLEQAIQHLVTALDVYFTSPGRWYVKVT